MECTKSISNINYRKIIGKTELSDWFFLGKGFFFRADCSHRNGYKNVHVFSRVGNSVPYNKLPTNLLAFWSPTA